MMVFLLTAAAFSIFCALLLLSPVLLAASGSVAAIKFENLCRSFAQWGGVKPVATSSALHFIDKGAIPKRVTLYTDEEEWSSWKKIGDEVLHVELRKWADIMVIAPLSTNTLAKIEEESKMWSADEIASVVHQIFGYIST